MSRQGWLLRSSAEPSRGGPEGGRSKGRRRTKCGSKSRPPKPFNMSKCSLPIPSKVPKTKSRPPKHFRRPKSTKVKLKARTAGSSSGQFQTTTAEPENIQGRHPENSRTEEYQKRGTIVVAKFVDSATLILGFDSRIDKISNPNWIGSEFKLRKVGSNIYSTMTGNVGKIKDLWDLLEQVKPTDFAVAKDVALQFFKNSEKEKDDCDYETFIISRRGSEALLVVCHLKYNKGAKPAVQEKEFTDGELAIGTGFIYADKILQRYPNKTQQKGETKRIIHESLLWSAINVASTGGKLHIARIRVEVPMKLKSYTFCESYNHFASSLMPPYERQLTLFLISPNICDKKELDEFLDLHGGGREHRTHPLCNLRGKYQLRVMGFLDKESMTNFWDITNPMFWTEFRFMKSITDCEFRHFTLVKSECLVIVTESSKELLDNLVLEKELSMADDIRFSVPFSKATASGPYHCESS